MKKQSALKKQSVRKKGLYNFWRSLTVFFTVAIKISVFLVALFVVSFLFLSLYEYLLTSHHIRLKEVTFKGADEHLKRELLERSKLNFDLSLLAINLDDLKQRMEAHPWVRSVQIKKQFPHGLVIQVNREGILALIAAKKYYYMNSYGEVFKELDPSDSVDYPIVTGISEDFSKEQDTLKLVARILNRLEVDSGPWSLKDLSEIHIEPSGTVDLYSLSYAAVVKFNGSEHHIKKDELKKVLAHLKRNGLIKIVKTIDFNYREGAVVSFHQS
jgi:cell division septal protein FtsQ